MSKPFSTSQIKQNPPESSSFLAPFVIMHQISTSQWHKFNGLTIICIFKSPTKCVIRFSVESNLDKCKIAAHQIIEINVNEHFAQKRSNKYNKFRNATALPSPSPSTSIVVVSYIIFKDVVMLPEYTALWKCCCDRACSESHS